MPKPRRGPRADNAAAILRAATQEFAACGYEAAGVDRIARRAKVNKALLYYYFTNKRALYQAVVRQALALLIQPLTLIVESRQTADRKIHLWIETLVHILADTPHVPQLMLRELADGGRHLDDEVLRELVAFAPLFSAIVRQGRDEKRFGAFDPLMLHFVLMGTTMLLASNAPIRVRVRKLGFAEPPLDLAPVVAHLQLIARRALRKESKDATHPAAR